MSGGRGENLAERVSRGAPHPATTAIPSERQLTPTTPGRHCWLLTLDGQCFPGLLLEWRQAATSWLGRVAYATPGTDSAVLHEEWVPTDRLKRADTDP